MSYTIPFTQLGKNDVPLAGGKGANLGEMVTAGFPIPAGFVLTTAAYDAFVEANNVQNKVVGLAATVTPQNPQSSETAAAAIKKLFLAGEMPDDIRAALLMAYADLVQGGNTAVMGTGVVSQRIKAGQLIRVDGHSGKVTLVDEVDPQEEAKIQAEQLAAEPSAARKRKLLIALVLGFIVGLIWWKRRRR